MTTIDPLEIDEMMQEDATYWACALMLAIVERRQRREREARRRLRALGWDIVPAAMRGGGDVASGRRRAGPSDSTRLND